MKSLRRCIIAGCLALGAASAQAVPFFWTDWQGTDLDQGSGFQAQGIISTGSSTVTVTYTNPQGVGFYQTGVGIDYFAQGGSGSLGRIPATSPYTSSLVDNIPTAAEMIGLQFAGTQTLHFSQAVANPVFAFVSLNSNGYSFDQDFEILSLGGVDGNDCGYWGCGEAQKDTVGTATQLNSNNVGGSEPHGVIRFLGTFDTLNWRSSSNEFWNGFTVGVQGTAIEVCATNPTLPGCTSSNDVPEPGSIALLGIGLAGLMVGRRRLRC